MDTGLLLLRLVVGLLFIGHGTQKLFGWFDGPGLDAAGQGFHKMGFRPGKHMAGLAGATEAVGGALFALGLLTPLAAAAIIGTMLNAAVGAHWGKGVFAQKGGFELPLVYAAAAAAVAFTGPGTFSLDGAFGIEWRDGDWGVAALAVGAAAGLVSLALRNHHLNRAGSSPGRAQAA